MVNTQEKFLSGTKTRWRAVGFSADPGYAPKKEKTHMEVTVAAATPSLTVEGLQGLIDALDPSVSSTLSPAQPPPPPSLLPPPPLTKKRKRKVDAKRSRSQSRSLSSRTIPRIYLCNEVSFPTKLTKAIAQFRTDFCSSTHTVSASSAELIDHNEILSLVRGNWVMCRHWLVNSVWNNKGTLLPLQQECQTCFTPYGFRIAQAKSMWQSKRFAFATDIWNTSSLWRVNLAFAKKLVQSGGGVVVDEEDIDGYDHLIAPTDETPNAMAFASLLDMVRRLKPVRSRRSLPRLSDEDDDEDDSKDNVAPQERERLCLPILSPDFFLESTKNSVSYFHMASAFLQVSFSFALPSFSSSSTPAPEFLTQWVNGVSFERNVSLDEATEAHGFISECLSRGTCISYSSCLDEQRALGSVFCALVWTLEAFIQLSQNSDRKGCEKTLQTVNVHFIHTMPPASSDAAVKPSVLRSVMQFEPSSEAVEFFFRLFGY